MQNTSLLYPATPENVDPQILQATSAFRKEATRVLGAILFFIATYIVLFVAALGLAALCAAGGIGLIVLKPMFITLMLGLGLAGLGVMVVVFLVKFLFKRHQVDRSALVEITAAEHPQLFEFIRMLSKETQTPFPKKVYLSPDVNASVFYDSSFWSMFFPVRKNLQIGLGLVNAVNVSEFKAIIAHEFGHFSQRSMKLGSYVYNMNHIIFNMLYDNEGYGETVQSWANASGYFAFFAVLTVNIVKGIQWILQQVYAFMNKIYMGLSRQMEFHADTVAASVSGGNNLVTALRRLDVADMTYNNVFNFYQENFKKGFMPENVYSQHIEVMRQFAKAHGLRFEHGLPQVDAASFSRFNKARVTIKNQWASHPSTDDRERHLQSLHIDIAPQHESAWVLFHESEKLQQQFTQKIFGNVKYETSVVTVNDQLFRNQYEERIRQYQLPAIYKGFFDGRSISPVDIHALDTRMAMNIDSIDQVLTDDVLALPHQLNGLKEDINTLDAITNDHLKIKNFEFDGKKFEAYESSALRTKLEIELRNCEQALQEADQKLIAWFLNKAAAHGSENALRDKYAALFSLTTEHEKDMKVYTAMHESLIPLYQEMPLDQIENAITVLKLNETDFRTQLERFVNDPSNADLFDDDQRKLTTEYLSKEWVYFRRPSYMHESLGRLTQCLNIFYQASHKKTFQSKINVLTSQLTLAGLRERVEV